MKANQSLYGTVPGMPVVQNTATYGNGSPLVFSDYKILYPESVSNALKLLFMEYNQAFNPLIEANREFTTDYGYCFHPGGPVNYFVQIDMCGLSPQFLKSVHTLSSETIYKTVRNSIFEIENSLAVYQFLQNLFPRKGGDSFFKNAFRSSLDALRHIHGMPIALLAVTEQKYQEMRQFEFGKTNGEILTDKEVMEISGFDCLLGPQEFKAHIEANHGACNYLLYARTSDPLEKLKKPDTDVEHPLLSDRNLRRIIKAHSITLNIDSPSASYMSKINDTKEYMPTMGMGYAISSVEDIFSKEFIHYLLKGKGTKDYNGSYFSYLCEQHLLSCGIDLTCIQRGDVLLRCKPMKNSYGCYGHVSGTPHDPKFRTELKSNLQKRGSYIVQPEIETPTISDLTGTVFTYIDRVFFATDGIEYNFIGGFRNMIPIDSQEAIRRRIHGSASTVYAEIC